MGFVTYRRHYVDHCLAKAPFEGRVLDVGGDKVNKRGAFRPPTGRTQSWEYLNLKESSQPDILGSAESIPLPDGSFDTLLLAEVVEHLEHPDLVLAECSRILRDGGCMVATIPFLYQVHGWPDDFQRWTPPRIERELSKVGLRADVIEPMGGIWAVTLDLIRNYNAGSRSFLGRVILRVLSRLSPLFLRLDQACRHKHRITTGYYIVARKVPLAT
jgi:SAM-dependent methyltransferase